MKALIYCRVSSQRQVDEGNGLGSQEQRCRVYAKNKNYDIIEVFPDEAISGALFQRPAMQQLIAYLDSHQEEAFVVIFDDLSRFARDVKTHIQLKAELISRGAKLECLNFNFDDSEESEFAELILAASNQYQRKSNRRQVIQKMRARIEKGYWPFMPPLGLINKKDPVHGKILTPCEPHSSIFKKSIEKFRDGLLLTPEEVRQDIHKQFEELGLLDRPALSSVQEILKNSLYAGYIEYAPWKVPFQKAKHEGFISVETFNLVQERLESRSKPWKRQDSRTDFPLRTFVICDACNNILTASWNKGRSARYPNYFCRTKGCMYNWKTVSKYKIEPEFEVLLSSSKPFDGYVDLMGDVIKEQWGIRFDNYVEYRNRIKSEMGEIDEEITSYLKRIPKTKDEFLIATYENEILGLRKKKVQIEGHLNIKKYTSGEFGTASDKVLGTIKNPMAMWKSDVYNDKRTIFFMYFEDKLRYDYEKGFGTASYTPILRLINKVGEVKSTSKTPSVEMSGSEPESE